MNELCLFIKDNFWAIFAIGILAVKSNKIMYPLLIIVLYQTFGFQNWYFVPLILFAVIADAFFPINKNDNHITSVIPIPVEMNNTRKNIQNKIDDFIPEDIPENHDINK